MTWEKGRRYVICSVCNKKYQLWNKSYHNTTKEHKMLEYCKKKILDINQLNVRKMSDNNIDGSNKEIIGKILK